MKPLQRHPRDQGGGRAGRVCDRASARVRGRAWLLLALGLVILTVLGDGGARPVAASGLRILGEPRVENRFPESLVFSIEAESDAEIREIRLRYSFVPGDRAVTAQPEFDRGHHVLATFTLRSGTRSLYLPPGKVIRYRWELRDANGNEIQTEERETTFADQRFRWQQVVDGIVQVNYYRGTQRDAEVMAQIANETLAKASQLLGARFDFPIKIWAYASQRDFQIALAHSSVTSDPGVLGQAHEPDTFIMVADRLSSPTALDTARHELTHLVTAQALRDGPFKDLYPSWLNEGTSVYMQVSPNDVGYVDELEDAIKKDRLIPLRLLTSLTRARDTGLFYGQSYAIVKFLIDTYGPEKFAQMVAEFKVNGNEDQTFKKVYGLDRDELYLKWRESVGLKAEPATARATPVADSGARASAEDTDSSVMLLAVIGTVVLVLLMGAAAAGGLLLARRARG